MTAHMGALRCATITSPEGGVVRTLIAIFCPECRHETAELVRGLDEQEPDLAVCEGCETEWELRPS